MKIYLMRISGDFGCEVWLNEAEQLNLLLINILKALNPYIFLLLNHQNHMQI